VVARILQDLGWNIWDTSEVHPGFAGPREDRPPVDFALCAPPDTPAVFIALCAPGTLKEELERIENALHDLHRDVPVQIAVAADGELWKFYAPTDEKTFAESSFRTLDLRGDDVGELESGFTAFLSKAEIVNGNARRVSRSILWQRSFAQAVLDILPAARRMVTEPPFPRLPEAIVTLATQQGFTITEEDAVKILTKTEPKKSAPQEPPAVKKIPPSANGAQDYSRRNIRSFRFLDRTCVPGTWKEMLVKFCEIVYELQGDEFHKCLSIGINNRNVFSKNIKDLFGNAPVQIGKTEYYVMTNFTANHIVQLVHRIMDLFGYPGEEIEITTD
jgi:negative regulator of replication initiation